MTLFDYHEKKNQTVQRKYKPHLKPHHSETVSINICMIYIYHKKTRVSISISDKIDFSLNKFKRIEITQSMTSDHNEIKL